MTKTKINVDATFGTEVKVGDIVAAGQQLGVIPGCGEPVSCKKKGVVREIIFDPEDHQFVIVIDHNLSI